MEDEVGRYNLKRVIRVDADLPFSQVYNGTAWVLPDTIGEAYIIMKEGLASLVDRVILVFGFPLI